MTHASSFMMEKYHNMKLYFPNPKEALQILNNLRDTNGFEELTEKEIKPYNECCFFREIKIKPLALIGTSKEMEDIAKEYGYKGDSLYNKYSKYSNKIDRRAMPNPLTKNTLKNKIDLIESVIKLLSEKYKPKAIDELNNLKNHYKTRFEA